MPVSAAGSEGFHYRRLAASLRIQIAQGVVRVGDRLPSVRTLRRLHHVSAATAVGAYLVLEREGYVEARERSGFYVARPPAAELPATLTPSYTPERVDVGELVSAVLRSADDRLVPLGLSSLGPELLPTARLNRALRRAMARVPLHSASYGDVGGVLPLRRQLARLLINSGMTCSAEDLIVTTGGLEALNLALRTVAEPGDVIAVESPTYFGVLQAIESLGLRAVEVPSHPKHGVDLALLERAIRRHRAKAAVVMTTCHNPLGSVMTDAAKEALVTLVTRLGVALIEDDVYGELAHSDPATTAGEGVRPHGARDALQLGLQITRAWTPYRIDRARQVPPPGGAREERDVASHVRAAPARVGGAPGHWLLPEVHPPGAAPAGQSGGAVCRGGRGRVPRRHTHHAPVRRDGVVDPAARSRRRHRALPPRAAEGHQHHAG